MKAAACVLGLLVAQAAWGQIVPPLEPDRGLRDLGSPLRRFEVLARARPADVALLHRAFLGGNWNAFEVWARLAMAGKLPPATGGTPHADFFRALLAAPAAERDPFLRFLLVARPLHAGLRDALGRPALPVCGEPCRKWLVRYLAAFPAPRHAADPTRPLGRVLVDRSRYPEELTVGLCGDLGLVAAIPHLERFVTAPRRFHQLFTDYGTEPEEVGALYWESLRALVKVAVVDPAQAPLVRQFLADTIAKLRSGERVWRESTGDVYPKPEIIEAAPDDDEQSRLPSLKRARLVLDGDAGSRAVLGGLWPLHPTARWVVRVDLTWPLEGRGGRMIFAGGRLVALVGTDLFALDLATGDRVMNVVLGNPGGRGISAGAETFATLPGKLVLAAHVDSDDAPRRDDPTLITLDSTTGDILTSVRFPPGLPGIRHGPDQLDALPEGVWYRDSDTMAKLGYDGRLLQRHAVENGREVRIAPGRMVWFTTSELTFEGRAPIPFDSLVPGAVVDSVELLDGGGVLAIARYDEVFAVGDDGKLRWKVKLDESWIAQPTLCGPGLWCFRGHKQLQVVALDGTTRLRAVLPPKTADVAIHGDLVFLLTETTLFARRLGVERMWTVMDGLSHMARLAGVTDRCVLLLTYQSANLAGLPSDHYLSCLPPVP